MVNNLRGKRCIFSFLTVLAIFCGFAGIVKGAESVAWSQHTNEYFSISYPSNWMVVDTPVENMPSIEKMVVFSDMNARASINVIVEDISAYNFSLEDYLELSEENLELVSDIMTPINTYKNGNAIKLNVKGVDAYQISYGLNLCNQGVSLEGKNMQILFIKNKKAYVVTYQALNDQFDTFSAYADKAIESFRFTD
ncbi:MAG: hypothetical protein GX175_08885 [Halanaerobiaceae bacterium]|nr:hypothetical protein [Halanaerobiaceae bacterium]